MGAHVIFVRWLSSHTGMLTDWHVDNERGRTRCGATIPSEASGRRVQYRKKMPPDRCYNCMTRGKP